MKHATATDEQLLRGYAASGDGDLFAELVRRFEGRLRRFVIGLVHNWHTCEDIVQNTFVLVHRFCWTFRGDCKASTWLIQIARNQARRFCQLKKNRTTSDFKLDGSFARSQSHDAAIDARDLLAKIPSDTRDVILLIELYGFSYEEVASKLHIALGTVRSRRHRALKQLREAAAWIDVDERQTRELYPHAASASAVSVPSVAEVVL